MTSPGRYVASDGSFARSASGAAARGGILIAIAVVIGVLLLWQGFDGGEPTAATDGGDDAGDDGVDGGDDAGDDGGPTVVVDPPETVKVAVANGRGEPGLGTGRAEVLTTAGYVAVGVNAATFDNELSRVYYTAGYEDEAKQVADVLGGGASVLDMAPADPLSLVSESFREAVTDFHIYVVVGADGVLG